jgi:hypothetical protein
MSRALDFEQRLVGKSLAPSARIRRGIGHSQKIGHTRNPHLCAPDTDMLGATCDVTQA